MVRAQPGKGPAHSQNLPAAQVETEAGGLDQEACEGVARALASLSLWSGRLTGNPRVLPSFTFCFAAASLSL